MSAKRKTKNEKKVEVTKKPVATKNSKTSPVTRVKSFFATLKTNRLNQFKLLSVALALALIALVIFGFDMYVVALVNNRPVFRNQIVKELEKQGGSQVLDTIITKNLIEDYARKNNVVISDDEVNAEIDKIKVDIEEQGLTLEQALDFQGQTMEDLRSDIRLRLALDKAVSENIEVTDEEVSTYFEENKELFGEGEEFDAVKEDIREQLINQKKSQEYQNWINNLKSEANIKYFAGYSAN